MTYRIDMPLLKIHVHPLTPRRISQISLAAIERGERLLVGNHNLHSAYLMNSHPEMRECVQIFDYALIDGFPIVLAATLAARKWLGSRVRVGSMDWVPQLIGTGKVARVAIVGATASSNKEATDALSTLSPGTEIRGWAGASWNAQLEETIISELADYRPNLVIVGLGMPQQEIFVGRQKLRLPQSVIVTVGGAIDQISGQQKVAPRWLGRFGVEWIYRLLTQPRRLGHRYLIEPMLFGRLIAKNTIYRKSVD